MHNGGQEDGAAAPLIVTVWTEGIFNVQMFFNDATWSYLWLHFQLICEFMHGRKVVMAQHLFIAAHSSEIPARRHQQMFRFGFFFLMNWCGLCITCLK